MIHFITFGNTSKYAHAMQILCDEARASGYFDTVQSFNENDIPPEHTAFVTSNHRGFGYWIWKPIIMLKTMGKYAANTDDIIIYADAGCGISTTPAARENFAKWIHDVRTHPTHRVALQMGHIEETWTKGELFEFIGCNDDKYRKTGQYVGGIQLYMNTPENREFVKKYLEFVCADNYHYVSDQPSRIPNAPSFTEHRHDQSVISLLFKKYGTVTYPDHWLDPAFPIMALRR
jgi:hypothetical protein